MASATPAAPIPSKNPNKEIAIYSHSQLFYWWPVWVLGFVLAIVSLVDGTRALHMPSGTKIAKQTIKEGENVSHVYELRAENADKDRKLEGYAERFEKGERKPRISHYSGLGAVYCIVLLVVVGITNVPLRGLWSLVVVVTVVLLSVIFGVLGWWDDIFNALGNLHIDIGYAGYLFISLCLLLMWAVATFLFDRQIYIIFTPGQMKVCEEVGGGEKSYDTVGMQIEKHRDDLFRHWVLGLGSGDLTVRTSGATSHTISLPNVLFVGRKLKQIEEMQREKATIETPASS
jgi:UDP-N-acetylmuramyl pentapeptide phosphotransferase/UDP-N-acetylglucosamine-1-phosphate transferase